MPAVRIAQGMYNFLLLFVFLILVSYNIIHYVSNVDNYFLL